MKKKEVLICISAANLIVFLPLNIAFPTTYFIPDGWYKLFFIFALLLVIFFSFIIFFLRNFKFLKKFSCIYSSLIVSVLFFYLFFVILSFLGNREKFYQFGKKHAYISLSISFIISTVFYLFKKKDVYHRVFDHVFLFLFPLIIFTFVHSIFNIFFLPKIEHQVVNKDKIPKNPRIVWMIFDEMDKEITFDLLNCDVRFKNLDYLKNNSFYADNALETAFRTNLVIPSLTIGKAITRINIKNHNTLLLYDNEKKKILER